MGPLLPVDHATSRLCSLLVVSVHLKLLSQAVPRRNKLSSCARYVAALMVVFTGIAASAQTVWNIADDWSDAINPNGVWSYNHNGNALPNHTTAFTGDSFTPNQGGWKGSDLIPIWFKSITTTVTGSGWTTPPDWQVGDVITHSPSSSGYSDVTWTSSINGTINVTGGIWIARNIGRWNSWSIYSGPTLGSLSLLTGGTVSSGDSYSRSSPFDFQTGSGGSSVLSAIPVTVGSIIQLRIGTTATGEYTGVDLRITAVPEPSAYAAMAGLIGLGIAIAARSRPHSRMRA